MNVEPGMEVGTWKGARPMLNFKGIDGQWVTRLFKGGLATVMLQCLGWLFLTVPTVGENWAKRTKTAV